MRTPAGLLAALFAAWITSPATAQHASQRPVTVAVKVDRAAAGAYLLSPAAGVRAVTPLHGHAAAGDLPLTFFLPPALGAGRQRIASLAVGGDTMAVWYDVPEHRSLRLPPSPVVEQPPGTTRRLSVAVENLGNVPERAAVQVAGGALAVRAATDSLTIPAGGSATFLLDVGVPGTARPGTSYHLPMVVTAGTLSVRGRQRIVVSATRRSAVPVEVGTAAPLDGSHAAAWIQGEFQVSDSIRVRGGLASGRSQVWPGIAGRRSSEMSVTAPGWRLSAGELSLPRPTELVPWMTGTGARVELGRTRGWSIAGSWIRDEAGRSSGLVSASMRRPGLHLNGALLSLRDASGSVMLPTLGVSTWSRTAHADLAAGLLRASSSGWLPVGSARGQLRSGPATISGSIVRAGPPTSGMDDLAVGTSANAAIVMRVGGGSNLVVAAGASRTERDSAGHSGTLSGFRNLRAGASVRLGALSIAPAVELRHLELPNAGERSVAAATTALTWSMVPGLRFRTEAGWENVAAEGNVIGHARARAEIAWTGATGYLSLLATYGGHATWSPMIAPATRAQLQAGLRGGWGSLDADAVVERQASGIVTYGSAAASLNVRPETDLLLGVRRVPRLGPAPPWEITVGVRSTLAIPVSLASDRRIVFDDRNGNGRRDAGEPGIAGVQLRAPAWGGVTDERGRFMAPDGAEVIPDLAALGPGWRIGNVDPRGIAVVRRGGIHATAYFADAQPNAVEQVPRGSIVLVGPGSAEQMIAAELDTGGSAYWSDLPPGRYRLFHVAEGAPPRLPPDAVAVDVAPGAEASVRVPASYRPRRIVVRQLDGNAPRPVASSSQPPVQTPEHAAAPAAQVVSDRCARPMGEATVRPGIDEASLRCLLGEPGRVSRRGEWTYWFYPRTPAGAGGRYDDVVFMRRGRVVTAILGEPGRRYDGPSPHQQLVEAHRGSSRDR